MKLIRLKNKKSIRYKLNKRYFKEIFRHDEQN